ncbi:MAG: hypothetical protein AAF604_17960 [Acidobacteriota bacterium]
MLTVEALRRLEPRGRRIAVARETVSAQLVRRLVQEHVDQRQKGSPEATNWALLAVNAAQLLSSREAVDCLPQALAHLGNAHRVEARFDLAERYLREAWKRCSDSAPLIRAEVASLYASVACDRRQFARAHRFLDEAIPLVKRHSGIPHEVAKLELQRANAYGSAGRLAEEKRTLLRVAERLDAQHDPRLACHVLHNLAFCLVDSGETAEARRLFDRLSPELVELHLGSAGVWRRGLLSARLAHAEGDSGTARETLRELRRDPPCGIIDRALLELALIEPSAALGRLDEASESALLAASLANTLELDAEAAAAARALESLVEIRAGQAFLLEAARRLRRYLS